MNENLDDDRGIFNGFASASQYHVLFYEPTLCDSLKAVKPKRPTIRKGSIIGNPPQALTSAEGEVSPSAMKGNYLRRRCGGKEVIL